MLRPARQCAPCCPPWLRTTDARLTDELWDAAGDIKARIVTFRALDADPQYMNALNDAWGLVANRARAAAQRDVTRSADS